MNRRLGLCILNRSFIILVYVSIFSIFFPVYSSVDIEVQDNHTTQNIKLKISISSDNSANSNKIMEICTADMINSGIIEYSNEKPDYILSIHEQNKEIIYGLMNVYGKNSIITESIDIANDNIDTRHIAHKISDNIFKQITGMKGIFSTKIAFVSKSNKNKKYSIQISDYDGNNRKEIISSLHNIMSPAWSPDGKEITYITYDNEKHNISIRIHNIYTNIDKNIISSKSILSSPSWSPNGKEIAFVMNNDEYPKIHTCDIHGDNLRKITDGWTIDTDPKWIDNRNICFVSDRGGSPQIYIENILTKKISRFSFDGRYNTNPSISPDRKNLVYLHRNDYGYDIFMQNLYDYSKPINVSEKIGYGMYDSVSISPNGYMVAYEKELENRNEIEILSVYDRKTKISISSKYDDFQEPDWSP